MEFGEVLILYERNPYTKRLLSKFVKPYNQVSRSEYTYGDSTFCRIITQNKYISIPCLETPLVDNLNHIDSPNLATLYFNKNGNSYFECAGHKNISHDITEQRNILLLQLALNNVYSIKLTNPVISISTSNYMAKVEDDYYTIDTKYIVVFTYEDVVFNTDRDKCIKNLVKEPIKTRKSRFSEYDLAKRFALPQTVVNEMVGLRDPSLYEQAQNCLKNSGFDMDLVPSTRKKYPNDYVVCGNRGMAQSPLYNILNKYLHRRIYQRGQYDRASFVWDDIGSDVWKIPCDIKNRIDGHNIITNKHLLHKFISDKWIAKTYTLINDRVYGKNGEGVDLTIGKYYIVRPVDGFSGHGITILQYNGANLEDAYRKAIEFETISRVGKGGGIIISEYITDIKLFEGRKMHIRVYLLCSVINKIIRTNIMSLCEIFTAKNPYDKNNLEDRNISDSHGKSTFGDPMVDFSTIPSHDRIVEMIGDISQLLFKTLQPYEESRDGFEIFACDILIKDDGTPILIEVNDKVGYSFNLGPLSATYFADRFFNDIATYIINPYYNKTPFPSLFRCKMNVYIKKNNNYYKIYFDKTQIGTITVNPKNEFQIDINRKYKNTHIEIDSMFKFLYGFRHKKKLRAIVDIL